MIQKNLVLDLAPGSSSSSLVGAKHPELFIFIIRSFMLWMLHPYNKPADSTQTEEENLNKFLDHHSWAG